MANKLKKNNDIASSRKKVHLEKINSVYTTDNAFSSISFTKSIQPTMSVDFIKYNISPSFIKTHRDEPQIYRRESLSCYYGFCDDKHDLLDKIL